MRLSLIAGAIATASARSLEQKPLGLGQPELSGFACDNPPALDPAKDGLPSAASLFDSEEALLTQVKRHQAIVRVPSVSYDNLGEIGEDERWKPFYKLHDVLAETYPAIAATRHQAFTLEKVNKLGLVYTLNGSDTSLKPILLAAHQDVVPVDDDSTWTYPPFDAHYDGTYLWGRGSSDDKNSFTALLSAVETLLNISEWEPKRTIVLAFGFDEESSGRRGAGEIGKHLTQRYGDNGIALILDEGGLGFEQLGDTVFALPSVQEKGHVDIWAELHVAGRHSSIPLPHSGIGIVAEIITALEARPHKPQVVHGNPVYNHLVCLARWAPSQVPELSKLLEHGDLDGLADAVIHGSDGGRFLIQTTQAVDIIEGGVKINAQPETVRLGVNHRVAPQDTIEGVQHRFVETIQAVVDKYKLTVKAFPGDYEYQQHVASISGHKGVEDDDEDYQGTLILTTEGKSRGTPVSPTSGATWDIFSGTIQHTFASIADRVVPAGELMTGNTDTRHYLNLTPNIYRWTPTHERGQENIHTVDERVRMDGHVEIVKFYYDLVRNFDQSKV